MAEEQGTESNLENVAEASEAPPSLRDTITSAMDEVETQETAPPASETEGAAQEAKQGLERGEDGKFKPAAKEATPATEQPATETPATEQPKVVRAPGSWRPALREKFGKLDPDVQQEIMKREREIATGFNEVSEVKKFRDNFLQTMNQYQNVINAEGGRPLETVHNLMKTANVLYAGTPIQKAQTVAAIIRNFGIDIEALDQELSGQGGQGGQGRTAQPDLSQLIQQQVQTALAPLLQQQQVRGHQQEQEAMTELQNFLDDPKNEFAYDVKDTMADLMELAAKRGEKLDLHTAYSRAILAHNDIAEVVARRKVSQQAESVAETAKAAKRKAVSITGAPARSLPSANNLRATIEAAMDQHSEA